MPTSDDSAVDTQEAQPSHFSSVQREGAPDSASEAYTDFTRSLSYGDYLQLDQLHQAHQPVTQAHDEHLFIAIHHVSEVWIDLIVRELSAAMRLLESGVTDAPLKMLSRVVRAEEQMTNAWDVLKTMTPADYLEFRSAFGKASGFQSQRYRLMEFMLGNRNPHMMRPHEHRPDLHGPLEAALHAPSVYDLALRLLAKEGFELPDEVLHRDYSQPYQAHESVRAAWQTVYEHPGDYWRLYELAEKLLDIEDQFRRWRFNHLTTVERVIGFKRGSGGTSGAAYLKKALDIVLFPELWDLRTTL